MASAAGRFVPLPRVALSGSAREPPSRRQSWCALEVSFASPGSVSVERSRSPSVTMALLWRRTPPLASVAVAFGALIAFDLARQAAGVDQWGLNSVVGALLLPYALFRWGAGREAAKGLLLILVWLVVTYVVDPVGAYGTVAGFGFFLFSAALGAAIRFHTTDRARAIE